MINITTPQELTRIYLITNCYGDPNKVYIGKEKSDKIRSRKGDHKNTYGKNIIFTYIDEINSFKCHEWLPLEKYWIEQFKCWGFEIMNKNRGGGGVDFMSDESKLKLSKPVLQYSKEGIFIKKWNSISEAHSSFGIKCGFISGCCRKKSKTEYGYIWRYEHEPLECNYKISPNKNSKAILQYNKNFEFIKEWNNSIEPSKFYNYKSPINITNCCNGKRKVAYNFIWRWKL